MSAGWWTATPIGVPQSSTPRPTTTSTPIADEAVCCLHGAIRLYLRAAQPDTPDDLVQLLPGQAAIVPCDRWHRLEVDEPTDLLAITVRRGTQLEKRTTIYRREGSYLASG
jgi:mannose-6-phosphate isomerase-like protein (cupin superfamily)